MTSYGVLPTGYARKPISVILAELEAAMSTEFGPGVIQTPQSPLGQLNGLLADLLAEVDERNLDLYQSYDPDQAEGTRLDTLARLRLISRGSMSDEELRRAITNDGQARVDVQDLAMAITALEGVTFARVWVNESGEVQDSTLERGFVALAVLGGDDSEIAQAMRPYIVPGVSTYGNTVVSSTTSGFCRSMSIIRPTEVEVGVTMTVRLSRDRNGCPPPSTAAIQSTLESVWLEQRYNGLDVTPYTLRSIIESAFAGVEFVSFQGTRDGTTGPINADVEVAFTEIAGLDVEVNAE